MSIQVGDYVTISEDRHPLTWEVVAIRPRLLFADEVATLMSGQSGRFRTEPVANLTLYKQGVPR